MKAFNPAGKTINVNAATTAPSGTATVATSNAAHYYYVYNAGSVGAFVAFGADASAAASAAVIPTGGGANSADSYPVPAGEAIIVAAPINSFVSAITASSTAEVYVTPCYLDAR